MRGRNRSGADDSCTRAVVRNCASGLITDIAKRMCQHIVGGMKPRDSDERTSLRELQASSVTA